MLSLSQHHFSVGVPASPAQEARGCPLKGAVPASKWGHKKQPVAEGGELLSGSRQSEKEEGRDVRLRPFGTPPSVVPKGRTSDAPLSALTNNTPDFSAPDVPLLRSTTLELYYNVEAIWLIY